MAACPSASMRCLGARVDGTGTKHAHKGADNAHKGADNAHKGADDANKGAGESASPRAPSRRTRTPTWPSGPSARCHAIARNIQHTAPRSGTRNRTMHHAPCGLQQHSHGAMRRAFECAPVPHVRPLDGAALHLPRHSRASLSCADVAACAPCGPPPPALSESSAAADRAMLDGRSACCCAALRWPYARTADRTRGAAEPTFSFSSVLKFSSASSRCRTVSRPCPTQCRGGARGGDAPFAIPTALDASLLFRARRGRHRCYL